MDKFVDENTIGEDYTPCSDLLFKGCMDLQSGCGHPPRAENIAWLGEAYNCLLADAVIDLGSKDTSCTYDSSSPIYPVNETLSELQDELEQKLGKRLSQGALESEVLSTLTWLEGYTFDRIFCYYFETTPLPLNRNQIYALVMAFRQLDTSNPFLRSGRSDSLENGVIALGAQEPSYSTVGLSSIVFYGSKRTTTVSRDGSVVSEICQTKGGYFDNISTPDSSDSSSDSYGTCEGWHYHDFKSYFIPKIHAAAKSANSSLVQGFSTPKLNDVDDLVEEKTIDGVTCEAPRLRTDVLSALRSDFLKIKGIHFDLTYNYMNEEYPYTLGIAWRTKSDLWSSSDGNERHPDPTYQNHYRDDYKKLKEPFGSYYDFIKDHRIAHDLKSWRDPATEEHISLYQSETTYEDPTGSLLYFIPINVLKTTFSGIPPLKMGEYSTGIAHVRCTVTKKTEDRYRELENLGTSENPSWDLSEKERISILEESHYGIAFQVRLSFLGYSTERRIDDIRENPWWTEKSSCFAVYKLDKVGDILNSLQTIWKKADTNFLQIEPKGELDDIYKRVQLSDVHIEFNPSSFDHYRHMEIPLCS